MRIFRRALTRVTAVALATLIALFAMTGVASAHAQLEGSDPPADDIVATAPDHVGLTFGEGVELSTDAIAVFDDHLRRVDNGPVTRVNADANRLQVPLRPGLANGTYTVSWHVSSADTHPVSGTFRFSIGAPSAVTGSVPGTGRNDTAGLLLGVMRVAGYVGLVLAPGLLLVTLLLWPAGLAAAGTRRLLYAGLTLLAGSALGSMLLQGVWASGRSLTTLWSTASALDTHSRRFDTLYALRFYLLVAFGVLLISALSRVARANGPAAGRPAADTPVVAPTRPPRVLSAVALITTLALLATWSLAGHAGAGRQTDAAVAADILHVLAMSVWMGGLVLLTVCLRPADRAGELAAALPRFSRLAFGCVTLLVATGSYQTWREVGSVPALLHTTFGRVLLVKLAGVLGLLVLGNLARRWVQRYLGGGAGRSRLPRLMPPSITAHAAGAAVLERTGGGDHEQPAGYGPPQVRALRRGLHLELLLGLAVLAVTAALVVSVPARDIYVAPFSRTVTAPTLTVAVRIDKPRTGDAVLRLAATTADGRAVPVTGLRGSLSLPSAGLGPLPLRLPTITGAAVDGREQIGLTFPRSGNWTILLTVQTSPTDAVSYSFSVPVH